MATFFLANSEIDEMDGRSYDLAFLIGILKLQNPYRSPRSVRFMITLMSALHFSMSASSESDALNNIPHLTLII